MLSALAGLLLTLQDPRPGVLVPKVPCKAAPRHSYALYLPSAYSREREWPVLFILDARGRGAMTAELFQGAAESLGYVVASSNDSRSDGPLEPEIEVIRDLVTDVSERFRLDARRRYATGFSGGARLSVLMARLLKGGLAGVLGFGGGFPDGDVPKEAPPFPFFGAVGSRDFNYHEMRRLDAALAKLGTPHRLVIFDGAHAWPQASVCAEGLEWMQRDAVQRALIPRDEAQLAGLYRSDLERARHAEGLERLSRLESVARDFEGLVDTAEAKAELTVLQGDRELAKARKREERRDADDVRTLQRLHGRLATALLEPGRPPKAVAGDLALASLLDRAANGKTAEDRASAERVLSSLFVQTGFYLPRDYREKKDPLRAALCLGVAAEIRPKDARVLYDLACARAQAGQKAAALEALEAAIAAGFRSLETLDGDADLAPLRGDERYQALRARLTAGG